MSTLDDVRKMQEEGKSEQEIKTALQSRGLSEKEISETLSQFQIKGAVSGEKQKQELPPVPSPQKTSALPQGETAVAQAKAPATQEDIDSEQGQISMMSAPQQSPQEESEEIFSEDPQEQEAFYQSQAPQDYGYSQPQYSSDTISEISEQIISEKLSPIRTELEKTLDLKTTIDSKISYIEERLKRIESIIDKLQLSILQKVGDYATDVSDIKREMVETQKSFKSLLEKKHSQHKEHKTHHHKSTTHKKHKSKK